MDEEGECYIGQYANDKRHGRGKLYDKDGKLKYDGEFIDGGAEYINLILSPIKHS